MNYKLRREKLLEMLPEYSITVMYSGVAPYSIGDEKYPFKVDRSFYYFTGIERENLYLVLIKLSAEKSSEMLFIEPFDERMAKWVGGKIKEDEAREISSIEDIRYVQSLQDDIFYYIHRLGQANSFTLCGNLDKEEISQKNVVSQLFTDFVKADPSLKVKNIFKEIFILRSQKDQEEIEVIRKAIAVTKEGIETMMANSRENIYENELEAYFDFTLKCKQCDHAFTTICATGKNATILHYSQNNQYAKSNDLVLCDLGAAYQLYSSDITRTFPVNGRFTERQKQIYDIVLRANKLVRQMAKPGLTLAQLNNAVIDFYQKELSAIGLLDNGKSVRDYYWHGVSHMLGLETHDISISGYPLTKGCVITNEPGLYLEQEGIGIRIEDDLLITDDGCEELSSDIIKEIDDIEEFMNRYK